MELWLGGEADASPTPEISVSLAAYPGSEPVPCTFPEGSRNLLRCELPGDQRSPEARLTIHSSNRASVVAAASLPLSECPARLPPGVQAQGSLFRLSYGVPNLLLSRAEMRTLGLTQTAE